MTILETQGKADREAIRDLAHEKSILNQELNRLRAKENELGFQGHESLLITKPTPSNNERQYNYKQICEQLHNDISVFTIEHSKYIDKHKGTFDKLVDKVERILKEEFPGIEVVIYGSYKTNLWMPWSDIDLVVSGANVRDTDPKTLLPRIEEVLRVDSPAAKGALRRRALLAEGRIPRHQDHLVRKIPFQENRHNAEGGQ